MKTEPLTPDLSYIHEALRHLAVPLDKVVPLERNPRKGKVDALVALLQQFGQLMPLTGRLLPDGNVEITVGNHRVLAARELGWSHIAVVITDDDALLAKIWAAAENHSHDIGTYDKKLRDEIISEIMALGPLPALPGMKPLTDALGWSLEPLKPLEEKPKRRTNVSEQGFGTRIDFPDQAGLDAWNAFVLKLANDVEGETKGARILAWIAAHDR